MLRVPKALLDRFKRKTIIKVQPAGFEKDSCEFYKCLRSLLRLARWFGFFPVERLDSPSIFDSRFNLKCWYGVYEAFSFLGLFFMVLLNFYGLISNELSLAVASHFLFYAIAAFSTVCVLLFAKNWPTLIRDMAEIEKQLKRIRLKRYTTSKINAFCYFILFLGFVEHLLSCIYVMNFVMKCLDNSMFSYEVMKTYFTRKLTIQTDYPLLDFWAGTILEIANLQATFLWTITDVIIINISLYLTCHFHELNKLINAAKLNKSTNWGHLRLQYSHLVAMVKKVDSQLCYIVLGSFFNNLFFSCLQLFNTFTISDLNETECNQEGMYQALHGIEHSLYYSFSAVFLLTRTIAVSLISANVNAYANEPISALGEVHASMYNMEIQRFYRQLTYCTVGLRGVFFYVTRQIILQVLGTIITYELVLLQFNNSKDNDEVVLNMKNFTTPLKVGKFNY